MATSAGQQPVTRAPWGGAPALRGVTGVNQSHRYAQSPGLPPPRGGIRVGGKGRNGPKFPLRATPRIWLEKPVPVPVPVPAASVPSRLLPVKRTSGVPGASRGVPGGGALGAQGRAVLPGSPGAAGCPFPVPPAGRCGSHRRYRILPVSVSRRLREGAGEGAASLLPPSLLLPVPEEEEGGQHGEPPPQRWGNRPGEGAGLASC